MPFSEKVLQFLQEIELENKLLPERVRALNPYKEEGAESAWAITQKFYRKFYKDHLQRRFIIGINPGRFGAGATGIPFTDTKRLEKICGISSRGLKTHEPSSVFMYEMIAAYGGPEKFYSDFCIGSVSPLGFVMMNDKGREINCNYYDDKNLQAAILPFIKQSLKTQIDFGLDVDEVYCLGTGKNYNFLQKLNEEEKLFGRIIPLEHPRYIMQYKNKEKAKYVEKYLTALKK